MLCGELQKRFSTMKILVIDDDKAVRQLLRMILEKEGYEVFEADNGKVGVDQLKVLKTDVVICDLLMPVQEGVETISTINELFPDIQVIAISGGGKIAASSYLSLAETLGVWKTFNKPVDDQELLQTLRELNVKK